MELSLTLKYLGFPIRDKDYVFGYNKSIVDSSTIPNGKLSKRNKMLSYYRVREAISSKIAAFIYIPGEINPADILSKHWGYTQIWGVLKFL